MGLVIRRVLAERSSKGVISSCPVGAGKGARGQVGTETAHSSHRSLVQDCSVLYMDYCTVAMLFFARMI